MDDQRKYEFVDGDFKVIAPGRTVKRIRALVAIASCFVSPGALGGYIESETNLSQEVSGDAWVYGDAQVSGNAQVYGDAWVSGNAQVSGNAWVSGDAQVYGNAQVSGNAQVYGDARVSGNARVYGNARVSSNASILIVGPIGSRGAMLTIHTDAQIGVRFSTGCFSGSRETFFDAISKTHGDNEHGNAYAAVLMLADLMVKPIAEVA